MQHRDGTLILSATDLGNHLGCEHLTQLERQVALGQRARNYNHDPRLDALRERGLRHELAYLDHLRAQGLTVEPASSDGEDTHQRVLRLMQAGADVIVQASLDAGRYHGRADVLLRRRVPNGQTSHFGDWYYEPVDTKLALDTRGATVLQLCLYAQLLEPLQGLRPAYVHVVAPAEGFQCESFFTDNYYFYFLSVQKQIEMAVGDAASTPSPTEPEPVSHCDICNHWRDCRSHWLSTDHLSLVANISRLQRRELDNREVGTLTALATLPLPLPFTPERGSASSYVTVREQARVQLQGRHKDRPYSELRPFVDHQGLNRLPEPDAGDVFFDIEGDPFIGTNGLEYLFGWVMASSVEGAPPPSVVAEPARYHAEWALNAAEEKRLLERFVDLLDARWQQYPGMHVYHYGGYESGAVKRLAMRHTTREEAVDRMLRGGLFVDLLAITRQAVVASVERYSLKDLEPFHAFERAVPLREASLAKRSLEIALELDRSHANAPNDAKTVQDYNADDCFSTLALRNWLERLRGEALQSGAPLTRPLAGAPEPSENLKDWQLKLQRLSERLTANVSPEVQDRDAAESALALYADLLNWEGRESKVAYWEYYHLRDMDGHELEHDVNGLANLQFHSTLPPAKKSRLPLHRYTFSPQDTKIRDEADVYTRLIDDDGKPSKNKVGTVHAIDFDRGFIDIHKTGAAKAVHPTSVFAYKNVGAQVLSDAVYDLGEWIVDHGADAPGRYRAARDLLLRKPPRLVDVTLDIGSNETVSDAAIRCVLAIDGGVLPIQGPPGTGKTYTGALMVIALLRAGKRVGICANSHKVVRNFLEAVVDAAAKQRIAVRCVEKVNSDEAGSAPPGITEVTDNADIEQQVADASPKIIGGTPWLFARKEMRETLDVLFVDEAGQLALARTLAIATSAKNLVLLGDPGQLEQPIQGSHPDGAGASALEHVLRGHDTMPASHGMFLDQTWRMHPDICSYTSKFFYEGRLHAQSNLNKQHLEGSNVFPGAGLWFVPCAHSGNQTESAEEVLAVTNIVRHLLADASWTDVKSVSRNVTLHDILIVAPYNMQVGALQKALPAGARVGTVDKFQGQEAAVVIYSMTTSTAADAPRGMEFLYSSNRLNVATSRARCAVILVANPKVLEPECNTPKQMKLANALCGYLAMATPVAFD